MVRAARRRAPTRPGLVPGLIPPAKHHHNWVPPSAARMDPGPGSGQFLPHSSIRSTDLNWRNAAVREGMANAMRFWLDRGVDGFRVDAIEFLIKDRRLRDNPPAGPPLPPWSPEPGGLRRRWTRNQPGLAGVLRHLRRVADEYPDRILVGELYASARQVAASLGGARGDGLHLGLDHQLAKSAWDAKAFRRAIGGAERHLAPPLSPTWAFSNTTCRAFDAVGLERTRLAALICSPCAGRCACTSEEIGMTDVAPAPGPGRDAARRDRAGATRLEGHSTGTKRPDNGATTITARVLPRAHRAASSRAGLRHGTLSLLRPAAPRCLGYERLFGAQKLTVLAQHGRGAPWSGCPPAKPTRCDGHRPEPGSPQRQQGRTRTGHGGPSSARGQLRPPPVGTRCCIRGANE